MTNPQQLLSVWKSLKEQMIIADLHKPESERNRWEFKSDRMFFNSQKINALESKLERVRDLITDNQIAKLKRLVRKGEI